MSKALRSLFTDQANAIREGLGDIGKITPADFPTKIREIVGMIGAGGSSADVCYVTFKSDDGTVEYGKKAVAVGDNCADPIARGVFGKPTKESTAQFDFTHDAWATEPNGATNPDALKAVTEDRVVYATFISVLRYYTITYFDGETLHKTESLAYGSMPSIEDPKKSGFSFIAWEPALATVTGNANYYAQWEEAVTFAGGSWEDIIKIAESGKASETFSIGDTREDTVDGKPVTYKIIGFNHDDLSDGSGKAPITIMAYKTAIGALFRDVSLLADVSYWENSDLRTYCNSTIFSWLQSELQAAIKAVDKKSDSGWSTKLIRTTSDKVWIPSYEEMLDIDSEHTTYVVTGQGSRYAGASKYMYNSGTLAYYSHWLRTTKYLGGTKNGPGNAFAISINQRKAITSVVYSGALVPYCFCI